MSERVVIEVKVRNDKCRIDALQIAVASPGLRSLLIEGERTIEGKRIVQLAITGEGIDSASLVNKLKKKVGRRHARIVNPRNVQDAQDDRNEEQVKPIELLLRAVTFVGGLFSRGSTSRRR